jgi:hypothetical protein
VIGGDSTLILAADAANQVILADGQGNKRFHWDGTNVILGGPATVPDEAYGVVWDGSLQVPTKNSVYDKIEALVVAIAAKLTGAVIDSSDALIPTLNAPWINYGSGFGGARYYKDACGVVHIEGMIQATPGSPVTGVTIFTLLTGYRPPDTLLFVTGNGGGSGRFDIDSLGNVIMQSGNTAFTSLSGISFIPA